MLGVNLNQAQAVGSEALTVTPGGVGVNVNVLNSGGSPLRLQIQGPTGAFNANDRWCANIIGPVQFIPWGSFNTQCWDNSGLPYANQPLTSAAVIVPGNNFATPFDFCLQALQEL